MAKDYVDICCDIVHMTKDAVLINDGDEDIWIPKSQIDLDELPAFEGERINATVVYMTEWIAGEKGLI